MKKVLVVGSGGREHALVWKLAQSCEVQKVYCASGNVGTAQLGENVDISPNNFSELICFCKDKGISLTVVGPEAPLAAGIVDEFEKAGLKIFGPQKAAAELEASKAFSKEIILASGVKTAKGEVFSDFQAAKEYVQREGAPIVIKADGLAAGKGVVVAEDVDTAISSLRAFMLDGILGESGKRLVVEECLFGKEASVMAFVDGECVRPFVISQDYKRHLDGDKGPNTGGMGAVSPTVTLADSDAEGMVGTVFQPVLKELAKRGIYYRGFLYAGLMIDEAGNHNVLEFNVRLGDPETQVLLPRLESDLYKILDSAVAGQLASAEISWSSKASACVVLSSEGYPKSPVVNREISGLFSEREKCVVFHAGTKLESDRRVLTSGGRVLAVSALADSVEVALELAYSGVGEIEFQGMHYRKDIGKGAI